MNNNIVYHINTIKDLHVQHSLTFSTKKLAEQYLKSHMSKYKIGDWIKLIHTTIVKITNIDVRLKTINFSGFDDYANEILISSCGISDIFRKAIPFEIKQELIKRAKGLGFKKGVEIQAEWVVDKVFNCTIITENYTYYEIGDEMYIGGTRIYKQGCWAKIIKDPNLTFDDNKLSIKCDKTHFEKFVITFNISGITFKKKDDSVIVSFKTDINKLENIIKQLKND